MRHPVPYVFAAWLLLFASIAIGVGLDSLWETDWIVYAAFAIGVITLLAAVRSYRRCRDDARRTIYHLLCALWFAAFGLLFGGMPGSLLGHAVAGEVGEVVGYFVSGVVGAIAYVVWGLRRVRRNEPQRTGHDTSLRSIDENRPPV